MNFWKMEGISNMFYAEYCQYGVNIAYASLNGNAYTFYAFDTKKERDEFVKANEYNGCNCICQPIASKQMYYLAGRRFELEHSYDFRNAHEVVFDRNRLNPFSSKCVLGF